MNPSQLNTAIISNDPERLLNFKLYLSSPQRKIFTYDFQNAFMGILNSEVYDMVLFDASSDSSFNFKSVITLRNGKLHKFTPFLFILNSDQLIYRMEVYKDNYSSFLIEPAEKFEILNAVKMLENVGQLDKRIHVYHDILESEKQLVNHLDPLLQIKKFAAIEDFTQALLEIQLNFVNKMELTFAVEKVVYLVYLEDENALQLNIFNQKDKKLEQKVLFSLADSTIKNALVDNVPFISERQDLIDTFIQELEETIGFEINSILFTPLTLFHKPHGGFAIINKIYRHNFSENDLTLALLTVQKLVFQLESIYLRNLGVQRIGDLLDIEKVEIKQNPATNFYANILESISFGLIVFTDDFKIKIINKFARDLLNTTSDEILALGDVVGVNAFISIKESIQKKQLPALRQEIMVARIGTQDLDLGYSLYPLYIDGKQTFVLTFMEISQSKHIQTEIIRMDRMASLGVLASA